MSHEELLKVKIHKNALLSNCITSREQDDLGDGNYGYSCHDSFIDKQEIKENIISLIKTWQSYLSIPKKMGVICFSCDALEDAEDVLEFVLNDKNCSPLRHNHYLIVLKDFEKNKIKIKSSLCAAGVLYIAENSVIKLEGKAKFLDVGAIAENKKESFSTV